MNPGLYTCQVIILPLNYIPSLETQQLVSVHCCPLIRSRLIVCGYIMSFCQWSLSFIRFSLTHPPSHLLLPPPPMLKIKPRVQHMLGEVPYTELYPLLVFQVHFNQDQLYPFFSCCSSLPSTRLPRWRVLRNHLSLTDSHCILSCVWEEGQSVPLRFLCLSVLTES